jgi:predicted RNase H-like HicB family nuclease
MTTEGGATVIEGAHDDDDALANLREASGMVLDALGGEVDDHEQTPLAPQDDATDELQAGIQAAAAVAREARQRAQEALRRHAHLFGAAPERPQ